MIGAMLFLGLKLNLKLRMNKVFARDILPENLIDFGIYIGIALDNIKYGDYHHINILVINKVYKYTTLWKNRYDILYI